MSPNEKIKVTEEDGLRSLLDHAVNKAIEARARYGSGLGLAEIQAMLGDASVVRYPTRIAFDTVGLEPGMFAIAQQCGAAPADGFVLNVHPYFEGREQDLPLLIAYHLVAVNYGEIAGREVAECFGAALLGLEVEEYYQRLCALVDELEGPSTDSGGCGGGCGS